MWRILLYYKYTRIKNPEQFAKEHLQLCRKLDLKGRILVADEGINGTVGGPEKAASKYMNIMRKDRRFAKMVFKISDGDADTFKKMFVRRRRELVTLNINEKIDPNKDGGTYLEPCELKKMYDGNEEFIIIVMRNSYEAEIGRFKNAVTLNMNVFKELPKIIDTSLQKFRDKKVVTYCTGGIRCEKASALLKKRGFRNVYQLHGGIADYGRQFPNDYWEGRLFVFDGRMQIPINGKNHEKILSKCLHCDSPWDQYSNCARAECNKLILLCPSCREKSEGSCSNACMKKLAARESEKLLTVTKFSVVDQEFFRDSLN